GARLIHPTFHPLALGRVRQCLPCGGPAWLPTRPLPRGFFQQSSPLPPLVFPSPRERRLLKCSHSESQQTTLSRSLDSSVSDLLPPQRLWRRTAAFLLLDSF